jgi:hypothetical protein
MFAQNGSFRNCEFRADFQSHCHQSSPKNVYSVINIYCDTGALIPIIFSAKREDPVRYFSELSPRSTPVSYVPVIAYTKSSHPP